MMNQTKFKETELGLIPEDWQVLNLGDVSDLTRGISYRSSDYCGSSEGLAFVNLKCVGRGGGFRVDGVKYYKGEYKKEQLIAEGDIFIANTDLTQNREVIGSPIIMPNIGRDACFSLDLTKVVPNIKKIHPFFLYYYLKSPFARGYMIGNSNGTTVFHLSIKQVPKLCVPTPGLKEQQKIAEVLGVLDEKIELNRKMNKTLEQIAQAIFKKWFIDDADPDWETKKLGDVVQIKYGKNLPTTKLQESGFPVFGGNGQIGFYDKYLYEEPQVLVACRGAASGKVNFSLPKSFITNNSLVLEYKEPLNYEFLKYLALNADFYSCVTGSAQPQITVDSLNAYEITIPDGKTLNKFNMAVLPITEKILLNNSEIETLSQIRDSLLPRLMSGKLRVK